MEILFLSQLYQYILNGMFGGITKIFQREEVFIMYQIKKRSGELELFELSKIKSAIKRTFDSCNRNYQESIIETISIKSVADAETKIKDNVLNVEDIQDSVEKVLMTYGYEDVAKAYILYRKQSMRVARASASLLWSHGRVPGTSPG